jgi:Leucine-rich repeat (LRR) protein
MLKNTSEIKENSNNSLDYFDINSNEISEIQTELNTLDLDINEMLI